MASGMTSVTIRLGDMAFVLARDRDCVDGRLLDRRTYTDRIMVAEGLDRRYS